MAESVDTIIVRIKAEGTQDFIKQLKDAGVQTEVETKKIKKSTDGIGNNFKKLGGVIAGVFALGQIKRFAQEAVGAFATFDQQLKNLSAITGLAGVELERLEESAKKLASSSRQSSTDVLNAFKLIGSAKPELLQNVDALEELTSASIVLSEASGIELPDSARILGEALNALQQPASEAGRIINVLASASQKGAKEIPFVTDALTKFGGIATSAGFEIEESVSAIELLGKAIPEASIVGTNLKNIFLTLQTSAEKAGRPLGTLSEELERLAPIQDNITELVNQFDKRNVLAIQTLIKNREEYANLQVAITDTNTAYEQQAVQADGAQAQIDKLNNAFKEFRQSVGELVFNALTPLIERLTNLLKVLTNLPEIWKKVRLEVLALGVALVGLKIGSIVTLFFRLVSALKLSAVATGIQTVANIGLAQSVRLLLSSTGFGALLPLLGLVIGAFTSLAIKTRNATKAIGEVDQAIPSVESLNKELSKTEEELAKVEEALNQENLSDEALFELTEQSILLRDRLAEVRKELDEVIKKGNELIQQETRSGGETAQIGGQAVVIDFLADDIEQELEAVSGKLSEFTKSELDAIGLAFQDRFDKLEIDPDLLGKSVAEIEGLFPETTIEQLLEGTAEDVTNLENALKGAKIKELLSEIKDVLKPPPPEENVIVEVEDKVDVASNSLKQLQDDLKALNKQISEADPDSPAFEALNKDAFDLEQKIKLITDRIAKLRGDKKVQDALKKINESLEKFRVENQQAQLESDDLEIAKVEEKYQALVEEAEKYERDIEDIVAEGQKAVANLRDKFNDRDLKAYQEFGEDLVSEAQRIALLSAELISGTPQDPLGKKALGIQEDIEVSGVDKQLEADKEGLEKFAETQRALGEDRVVSEAEIAQALIDLEQNAIDQKRVINEKYRKEEAQAEKDFLDEQQDLRLENAEKRVSQIAQGADELFGFFKDINDTQQQLLENRLAKGLISQEEFDKKSAELKAKQAKADKAQAIFNIGINTAQGIIKTIANLGLPVAIPFIGLLTALALAQVATVLQTPIPKFAKGTKGKRKAPAGMAWVGEEGAELIQMKGGEKVITNQDSEQLMKILGSYSIPVQFQSTQDRMNKKINLNSIGKSSTGSIDISPMLQATERQSRVLSKKLDRLNNHFERVNFGRMITKN